MDVPVPLPIPVKVTAPPEEVMVALVPETFTPKLLKVPIKLPVPATVTVPIPPAVITPPD